MKLSKKILAAFSAAALLAMAGTIVSCADDDENAFSGKKVDFDNSYVTVTDNTVNHADAKDAEKDGVEKNTKYFYRAFNKLAAKHEGSTCTITFTPQTDGIDTTARQADGGAGFVFDMSENDDKTYNFIIATLAYNATAKQVGTYISKFTNAQIKDNNFSDKTNFTDKDGTKITTTENSNGAQEVEIVTGNTDGSTAFTTTGDASSVYYGFKTTDFVADTTTGNVVVVVKVVQDKESGDYAVEYYKSASDAADSTVDPVASFTVYDKDTLTTGCAEAKMAMYANIYPGKHFVADFDFTDTVGNAIPFEDEVIAE